MKEDLTLHRPIRLRTPEIEGSSSTASRNPTMALPGSDLCPVEVAVGGTSIRYCPLPGRSWTPSKLIKHVHEYIMYATIRIVDASIHFLYVG